MSTEFAQIEAILPRLSAAERLLLAQQLTRETGLTGAGNSDLITGIDVDPRVCGGEARIVRTRIPVWLLEQARRLGKSNSELLAAYPSLRDDDLINAWRYVELHRDEIEQQIVDNEAA
ncbi:DUF433 domain-containing protein [Aeoliella sp. SH292]|uniref:DUF433 domain-containing protein n=1 Tax=Aeoliella sp. SH292 TaxID=3454464 RepID=UPI003F95552C